jgi:membrane fusion protein, multidrug efflux system
MTRSGAALCATLLLFSSACQNHQALSAPERPPVPVNVVEAISRNVPVYLDEVGRCVAREVVSVQPQVSGRITELLFTDGADLKKGDPLFTIDPRPFQAALHSAEANLAQAKAALDLANVQYARVADLVGSRAIAKQDYDTRKNTVAVDEAQVAQAQAAVETARLNLDYTSIRSPIDGRAGHRLVDIGNVVTANQGTLLSIQRLDPIYADFTVAENDLGTVQQSMKHGTLKVEVRLPDDMDHPVVGDVTFVDNAVQDATGTLSLRATIPNDGHRLWPGRFVKVRLILNNKPGAVLIPAAAPQMSARGPFVYVIHEDSTAELRQIVTGQRQGDLIVVDSGLTAGERVVINGQLAVAPKGKVRVVDTAPSASTGGAPAGAGSPASSGQAASTGKSEGGK